MTCLGAPRFEAALATAEVGVCRHARGAPLPSPGAPQPPGGLPRRECRT